MSERQNVPLSFKLDQNIAPGYTQLLIWLTGDLDGKNEAKVTLGMLGREIRQRQFSVIIINVKGMTVAPEGKKDWLEFIVSFPGMQFVAD